MRHSHTLTLTHRVEDTSTSHTTHRLEDTFTSTSHTYSHTLRARHTPSHIPTLTHRVEDTSISHTTHGVEDTFTLSVTLTHRVKDTLTHLYLLSHTEKDVLTQIHKLTLKQRGGHTPSLPSRMAHTNPLTLTHRGEDTHAPTFIGGHTHSNTHLL